MKKNYKDFARKCVTSMHICIFRKGQKWCNIQGKIKKKRKNGK